MGALLVAGALVVMVGGAHATFRPGSPPTGVRLLGASPTEMTMNGTGAGHGVSGFVAAAGSPFDPLSGYPTADPTSGFSPLNEGFAGIIFGTPASGGRLSLFCIDLHTLTYGGIGYGLGDWDAANVPNVGYVARVLNDYYPNTNEPASLTDVNDKAAAVQAAVWFLTDRFVLATGDPLHNAVAALVTAVISAGPIVQPPPPSLTISPSTKTGRTGQSVGPFTLNSSVPARVTATGASMFADAAATQPIANGDTVAPGTAIYLTTTTVGTATLTAVANATVPTGNVYLYSGNISGVNSAQKLILAQSAELQTTVRAQAQFEAFGSLKVQKTIAGPGAGKQGEVVIAVTCDRNTPPLDDFRIPAKTPAKTVSHTYTDIPAGAVCTVTETADGHTDTTPVTVSGSGQPVTVPANDTATAEISDTYTRALGELVVHKTITGPAAGQQGPVRIRVVCDETPDTLPVFEIDARTPAGTVSKTYEGIPAGAVCTVTEMFDGATTSVLVTVNGSPQQVTVPAGSAETAELTDTYTSVPGSLVVQKSIGGGAAGRQGEIRIAVDCHGKGSPDLPDFVIPARTGAGTVSHTYGGIPAGAVCNVTETQNGRTLTVDAVVIDPGGPVTIPAGGTATVDLSDLYEDVPGELVVTKSITGPAAGLRGPITIVPSCDGKQLAAFVIPIGAPAGTVSPPYPVPAGASCTATETVDGHTSTVAAAVTIGGEVTIPAAGSATVTVTNTYTDVPGTLVVNKTIAGNAAGRQGQVTISVTCGETRLPDFVIPSAAPAGTVSKTYTDIAAGSVCTVTETADGHTTTISVAQTGSNQQVTVPAAGAATADLSDTYTDVPGSLVVRKTIAGPAAGRHGRIVIIPTCDGVQLPPFVIAAGAAAGDVTHTYSDLAAGSTCDVVETVDGHTDTVAVQTVGGKESVVVPAAGSVTAALTDRYSDVPGSLVVEKTITGDAAGNQGAIEIQVRCDKGSPALADFRIAAGAPAGTVSHTYAGLPAGATCVATETADGKTAAINVVLTITTREATIPAGDTATIRVGDAYSYTLPDLVVKKEVTPEAPAGTDVDVKLTVVNEGTIPAKQVTVCLRLHHAIGLVKTRRARIVRNGACWRVVRIAPKRLHKIAPIARSFRRRTSIRACNRVTVEVRGVDLRKARACTKVLAVVAKKGGGVTG